MCTNKHQTQKLCFMDIITLVWVEPCVNQDTTNHCLFCTFMSIKYLASFAWCYRKNMLCCPRHLRTYTNMLHATFFEIKGKKRQKSVKSGFLVALFFMWHSGVSVEGPCVTSRWSRTLSFHRVFPTPRLGCIYFVMGKLAETYLQKKEEWWDETIPLSTFHFKVSK